MSRTGTQLREERERRGMSLSQLSEATGVSTVYLEAMENGAFDALPGRAFGKLYIRAYAEVLTFDPRPLIDLYDDERRGSGVELPGPARPAPAGSRPVAEAIARWRAARSDVETEQEAEPELEPEPVVATATEPELEPIVDIVEPEPEPVVVTPPQEPTPELRSVPERFAAPPEPPRARGRALVFAIAAVVGVLAIYLVVRGSGSEPAPAAAAPPRVEAPPPAVVETVPSSPPVAVAPPKSRPVPPAPSGPPSDLSVTESGVGRKVVASRLQGVSDRFTEGDVVCFQTRVIGGKRGDAIRHVWIYEGRAQQSISLRVNDADWRTHSAKTIYKMGSWTVEARDGAGRVLASAEFTCVKRGG